MTATGCLRSLLSFATAVCALGATGAFAQAPPPPPPPVLTAEKHDNGCGWGLGGAAAGMGAAALLGPRSTPANWSGLYFGGHLGCNISDTDWTLRNSTVFGNAGGRTSFDNGGLIAGGQIGYNFQFGKWVLGLEASLSGGNLADQKVNALNPNPALNSTKLTSDMRWLFQVTPRLGYAFAPQWHGYIKGGFASAEMDSALFVANGVTSSTTGVNGRHNGWTVGAGLEYMLAQNLILGVDYSFISLDAVTRSTFCNAPCGVAPILTVDPGNIHMITGRISFKLGDEPARAAPLK